MTWDTAFASRTAEASETASSYAAFIDRKSQADNYGGFEPIELPDFLFDFQAHLADWAIRKGRAAVYADTGMGKTLIELVFGDNVVRHANGRVLLLTPLAVGPQILREAIRFGIPALLSRDGALSGPGIYITNYERLHYFNPTDFVGCICDESSIIKHFTGATQKAVTRFMAKLPYRLLCTATAAPNDWPELGTSAEALGELGYTDMLARFFILNDKKRYRMNDVKAAREANGNHYARLAYRVSQQISQWRLKGHAEGPFWQWVCSWARACRMPSDLGFDDGAFRLPTLHERYHVIDPKTVGEGMLFQLEAFGLKEEREERTRTLHERCETVAALADHGEQAIVWCHYNPEGKLLTQLIDGAVEVYGTLNEEEKETRFQDFVEGKTRVLVTKPKIGGWGLNFQHCAHDISFVSHSFEQRYQTLRRIYRFGQHREVTSDIVASKGEAYVLDNLRRKAAAADIMFANLVEQMNHALHLTRDTEHTSITLPSWLG